MRSSEIENACMVVRTPVARAIMLPAIEPAPGTVEALHAVRIWPSRGPCDSGPFSLGVRSGRTPRKNSPAVSRPHSGQTRTACT